MSQSRLVDAERFEKRISLVFTRDRIERSPDVVPDWAIWFVIGVVVNGLAELAVLRLCRDGIVRAGCGPIGVIVVAMVRHPSHPSPTAGMTLG